MPARSDGHAAGDTSAQSSPAIAVPGVGTAVGSPAASDAVRQAAVTGSTPITGTPRSAPWRAAAAASEPTPTGTRITSYSRLAGDLGEERRVAVDHPLGRAAGLADVGDLQHARLRAPAAVARATASS